MDTVVGYSGGTTDQPTYESIGDHTECLRVVYDPAVLSYRALLDWFFTQHSPGHNNLQLRQYMNGVWTHTPDQAAALAEKVASWSGTVQTHMAEATPFFRAEEYHQRFYEKQQQRHIVAVPVEQSCGGSL